jgi:hypothetical protein
MKYCFEICRQDEKDPLAVCAIRIGKGGSLSIVSCPWSEINNGSKTSRTLYTCGWLRLQSIKKAYRKSKIKAGLYFARLYQLKWGLITPEGN